MEGQTEQKHCLEQAVMEQVEILSQLCLTEEERQKAAEKLEEILTCMDKLNELDTEGVPPLYHAVPVENVFRADVVSNEEDKEAMLSNAPKCKEGQYQVPRTI